MFPLGDELYHHTVNQPLLFVNTETFHWKKNIQQIQELLNNEAGRLIEEEILHKNLEILRLVFELRQISI
jgi:hypothetical protein